MSLENLDVFCEVQSILAAVSSHVSVENVVTFFVEFQKGLVWRLVHELYNIDQNIDNLIKEKDLTENVGFMIL